MNYGFVIDNRRCIGCHACTVACKAEHQVPLGEFRTWVKYVEKGRFPAVRRYFTVLRCNHCEDAPCVNICPTAALFHRRDGIVDFNHEHCIACKSCMAACPYDALYLDSDSMTAAKCNYCAHRIEVGLEPPCVSVCPGRAIVAGDVDDPGSPASRLISSDPVSVRKPEKGTQPKVFYVEGDFASLTPGAAPRPPSYLWAERPAEETVADPHVAMDSEVARTAYDVAHEKAWGVLISLCLWTKLLAAGPVLVASWLMLLGYARAPVLFGRVAPLVALALTLLATLLLIGNLERPERFLKVLFHPNLRSWLVWGALILVAYAGIAFLWVVAGVFGAGRLVWLLLWAGLIFAFMAAGYSGFVLAQARARDLWQSRLLFPHLVVQSFVAGSALLVLGSLYLESGRPLTELLFHCLLGGLCVHGVLVLSEMALPHGTRDATEAVRYLVHGPLARSFWLGAVLGGIVVPIHFLAFYLTVPRFGASFALTAAVLALVGLLSYQDCHVRAGQALPQS